MRSASHLSRRALLRAMSRLRRKAAPRVVSPITVRRVLVVRIHNEVGDALLMTPSLTALRGLEVPPAVDVVARRRTEPVLRGNPSLDRLWVLDPREARRNPAQAWRTLSAIRAFRPDVAVVPAPVSFSLGAAALAWMSGARVLVGGPGPPGGVYDGQRTFFDVEVAVPTGLHHIERNRLFFAPLGVRRAGSPAIHLDGVEAEAARARLRAAGLVPRRFLAANPGAGKPANRWSPERFGEAAARIARRTGLGVLLMAGPGEDALSAAAAAPLAAAGVRIARLDALPWREVAAVLSYASLALCNDTGFLHLASAAGCRTASVFGPTSASVWAPRGRGHAAVQSPTGRVEDVRAGDVVRTALALLRARL